MEFKEVELITEEGTPLREIDRARSLLDKLPIVAEGISVGGSKLELRVEPGEVTLKTWPGHEVNYRNLNHVPREYELFFTVQASEYVAQGPYFDLKIKDPSGIIISLE